jgi:hypothetical protein
LAEADKFRLGRNLALPTQKLVRVLSELRCKIGATETALKGG